MKETVTNEGLTTVNHFANNNGDTSSDNNVSSNNIGNGTATSSRKYAVVSTEWISAIGDELGMQQLSDPLLRRLAEDASYWLREVLHKCATRLRHSKRRKLMSTDVNEVITNLCDSDPVLGTSDLIPKYNAEANVFVPCERIIDLVQKVNEPLNIIQNGAPYIQEIELVDAKLTEARNNYAKRALKTLFNGSQKTFQVLLNDCTTNACLGGEGVVDKLMLIARSTIISNNAQYTRVLIRTCQLIVAIASNEKAVYPYHLNSVDKLTDLLLKLLLGNSYINPKLEVLFKECALKLMLRWPSVADKYVPTLSNVIQKETKGNTELEKKKISTMELLAAIQPTCYLQKPPESPLSLRSIMSMAKPGSILWQNLANSICAFSKSGNQPLNLTEIIDHYGDQILPYLIRHEKSNERPESPSLPIIIKTKISYTNVRPVSSNKIFMDRQTAFPQSTLQKPRREINFAFAGGRPVPPSNLKRASLRADYHILRNEIRATYALVASRRLYVFKIKRKRLIDAYNLANVHL